MKLMKKNHTVCTLGYHIIFCTKYRHEILKNDIEVNCKRIISDVCIHYHWLLKSIEIMPDHVHIFIQAPHTVAPSTIIQTIKSISAVHLFTKYPDIKKKKFWGSGLWSKSTYIGSVGHVSENTITKYIESQQPHFSSETSSRGILGDYS